MTDNGKHVHNTKYKQKTEQYEPNPKPWGGVISGYLVHQVFL